MNLSEEYSSNINKEVDNLSDIISYFYNVPKNINEIIRVIVVSAIDNEQTLFFRNNLDLFAKKIQNKVEGHYVDFNYMMSAMDKLKEIIDLSNKIEESYLKEGMNLYLMIKTESVCQMFPEFELVMPKDNLNFLREENEKSHSMLMAEFNLKDNVRSPSDHNEILPISLIPCSFDQKSWDTSIYLIHHITLYSLSIRGILLYNSIIREIKDKNSDLFSIINKKIINYKLST